MKKGNKLKTIIGINQLRDYVYFILCTNKIILVHNIKLTQSLNFVIGA